MRAICLVCAILAGSVAAAANQSPAFWSFLESGRTVTRCALTSAAHAQAINALARLDEQIVRLPDGRSPHALVNRLHELLKTECFVSAAETNRVPTPDSALSLKTWWTAGGHEWLDSYVDLPKLGPLDAVLPHIVVPPDARHTLALDEHRDHPLNVLLCPTADASCGAETAGWRMRAETAFEIHYARGRFTGNGEIPRSPEAVSKECEAAMRDVGESRRYQRWRQCVEDKRPQMMTLPLGRFKSPTDGWVIVAGRRGHYDFCDTTRAYDLATGTAFVHDSCSALALESDGNVNFAKTDKQRALRAVAGRISVDNLREAVWMMLLRGEAEKIQPTATYYPLPAGVTPSVRIGDSEAADIWTEGWVSTGQTNLTWTWIRPNQKAVAGELTWPDSSDAAADHAASLLAVAEAGMVEGCARRMVPDARSLSSPAPVRLNHVSRRSLRELEQAFATAAKRWKALPQCR